MTAPILRSDPNHISDNLKEAVTEGLLNNLYYRVSGQGECGKIVIGERPSSKYISGFIEPWGYVSQITTAKSVDENTNPIHIVTIGFDVLTKKENSEINVNANFSIYVRVLPTRQELENNPSKIQLANESRKALNQEASNAHQQFKIENQDLLDNDKPEFYRQLAIYKTEVRNKYLTEALGLKINHININDQNIDEKDESKHADVENKIFEDNDVDPISLFYFEVYPGMEADFPEGVFKHVKPLQKWLRLDFNDLPSLSFRLDESKSVIQKKVDIASDLINEAIEQRMKEWVLDNNPETGGGLWAYPNGLTVAPNDIRDWDVYVDKARQEIHSKGKHSELALPEFNIRWSVELFNIPDDPSVRSVRIALENHSAEPSVWDEYEHSIFQANIEANVPLQAHVNLKLDRINPSYRYNEYLKYPALGFNNGITHSIKDDAIFISTTWMPRYVQPRIKPRAYDVDVRFSELEKSTGIEGLTKLPEKFDLWIEEIKSSIDPEADTVTEEEKIIEREKFISDVRMWKRESKKIRAGVEILKNSATKYDEQPDSSEAVPFIAWKLMNESMRHAASNRYESWHLFQVAFVLSNITGLVSRMPEFKSKYDAEWDEAVALLYFSTGGGKTEAFFGLLIFNLFLDRLRGKKYGVTAMIHYPLRLLTIQQAQRLSKIMASAERVKRDRHIEGNTFEIGFWVGRANTPNRLKEVSNRQVPIFKNVNNPNEDELLEKSEYEQAMETWNKLPNCPFCNGETVLRKYKHKGNMLGHACLNNDCYWNNEHGGAGKEPLPFYIVDEDIYDFAPSVIMGTVDKLALIGNYPTTIRRFMGMFGLAHWQDVDTGRLIVKQSKDKFNERADGISHIELYPTYENGHHLFFDPFPSLIIQDEIHLLEESLGTFAGLFETTLEAMFNRIGENSAFQNIIASVPSTNILRYAKIIAASATVIYPERQIQQLYQRKTVQFPYPGPTLYESFYAAPEEPDPIIEKDRSKIMDIETRARRGRLYVCIMTNGKPHTSTTVSLLANFHLLVSQYLLKISSDNTSERDDIREDLISALTNDELYSDFENVIRQASLNDIATLIDLHRIALTYVTNKKGGDQIMAAEGDATVALHENEGIKSMKYLDSRLISGAVDVGGIQEVIREVEYRPSIGSPLQDITAENTIRSVIATSAISHGVDLDVLNSMFFAGMPTDIAEYIQASSRVGRIHVGFVVLIPTPQKRRDRYILEIHDIYHRFLERMIRPTSVDRWAENALYRVAPSLLQAYLIGVKQVKELLDLSENEKNKVGDYSKTLQIRRILNKDPVKFIKEIEDFFIAAIGLHHPEYRPPAYEIFGNFIVERIRDLVEFIENHDEFGDLTEIFNELDRVNKDQNEKPMTSLRDVDPSGKIVYSTPRPRIVNESEAAIIMRVLRRGYSNDSTEFSS